MKLKPTVAGLIKDGYKVDFVNCNNNRSKASKYKVRYLPTFVYVENGKEVRRKVGSIGEGAMKRMCSSGWF